jgi:hypothetical protein
LPVLCKEYLDVLPCSEALVKAGPARTTWFENRSDPRHRTRKLRWYPDPSGCPRPSIDRLQTRIPVVVGHDDRDIRCAFINLEA